MKTSHVTTSDGKRIVYDVVGEGPAIIMLHGGGPNFSRKDWHEYGYVSRLRERFTVITMDIRGHGESDQPANPSDYAIERMGQDVLAVADACGLKEFVLWGFSFGGNIGRFLAVRSNRVRQLIVIGIPMGTAVSEGPFRDFVQEFQAFWQPIVQQYLDGTFDKNSLAQEEREVWQAIDVPVMLAWLTAMLDWGSVEPIELPCPTLWLSGSENEGTIASIKAYADQLPAANVQVKIVEGLDHIGELEELDVVFPKILTFIENNLR